MNGEHRAARQAQRGAFLPVTDDHGDVLAWPRADRIKTRGIEDVIRALDSDPIAVTQVTEHLGHPTEFLVLVVGGPQHADQQAARLSGLLRRGQWRDPVLLRQTQDCELGRTVAQRLDR